MRTRALFLVGLVLASLVAAGCAGGPPPRTRVSIGIGYFHDHLAVYGDWLWVDAYGWVWTPWDVPSAWIPYTYGHWILTSHGWTWVSSWPWGWATFHYGRWTLLPEHGWVWIPGTHWAPAWVAWHRGPGAWGWAPLPPTARWDVRLGLLWDGLGVEAHAWSFVAERDFLHEHVHERLLPPDRAHGLLRDGHEVTRIERGPSGIRNPGIPVADVERVHGRVPSFEIHEIDRPPSEAGLRIDRDPHRVPIYRPEVRREPGDGKPPAAKRPTRKGGRGHGD